MLEIDLEYPKILEKLHNERPILPERITIKKCHKLAYNLYDKSNNVADIRTLK